MLKRQIFVILTIVWMILIFCFSGKNAQESTKDSNAVGMLLGRIVYGDFQAWPEEQQLAFADRWSYPIRKAAHMTEYAILGILLTGASDQKLRRRAVAFTAFLIAVLYAMSDEIHQYFVPGRACMLADVGYDAAGAAAGIACAMLFLCWRTRRRGRNSSGSFH